MSDRGRRPPTALERKLEKIQSKRRFDPLTGRAAEGPSEAILRDNHSKLATCHQHADGPCKLHTTLGADDKRCAMSRRMQVSCPYLGKITPLKTKLDDAAEERRKDEMIEEEFPEIEP